VPFGNESKFDWGGPAALHRAPRHAEGFRDVLQRRGHVDPARWVA